MSARTRPARLSALRSAWRPMAAYWLMLVVLFSAFCVAALIDEPSGGTVVVLVILGGTTAAAVAVGQALALLRVRDWVVYLFSIIWWTVGALMAATLGMAVSPLGALAGFVVFIFPFFLTGGLWSLRTGRALFAAWVPLMYASGAAIIVAEQQGKVATWQAGSKWAIWDISTFGVLVVGIVLLLAYLLAREGYRLALWRHGPTAPLPGGGHERTAGRPRLTLLGWIILCGLAFGVAVGAAVLSPYLWRTHEDEDGQASQQADPTQQDEGQPSQPQDGSDRPRQGGEGRSRPSRRKVGPGEGGRMVEVREDARPDQRGGGGVTIDPLVFLGLLLAGVVLGGLPVRRLIVVQRLKHPGPDASATAQIEGWWRLVEIGLLDAGAELRPGESPQRLLSRALPALRSWHPLDVEGLAEAAEIRDRVAYGLGVDPRDLPRMEQVAVTCFETIWDRIGDRGQIRALYRPDLADPGDADVG